MTAAVSTDGLSKEFDGRPAVRDLNLVIHEGEMFALVGPDGAGKTTTIRMLCGLITPSRGSASVMGHDILQEPDAVKEQIGYLSQKFSLYGDLSIDENIEFFAEINGVFEFTEKREDLLHFTRLLPFRERLAERLSGGMKQKLALACTLIHTPRLLLLDEPTTGVDPVSRRDFWSILHTLRVQGLTIIMTTPYLDEAERCSRVAFLNQGRMIACGTPEEIKAMMKGEIVEIVSRNTRSAADLLKGNSLVREVHPFGDRLNVLVSSAANDGPALMKELTTAGIEVAGWRAVRPSLENAFISLVTHGETEKE